MFHFGVFHFSRLTSNNKRLGIDNWNSHSKQIHE